MNWLYTIVFLLGALTCHIVSKWKKTSKVDRMLNGLLKWEEWKSKRKNWYKAW